MFVHHIATICLMAFSWVCNLHRIGTLVLLIHDCADIFLEVSCMCLTFVCEFVNAYLRCLHLCITLLICCSITVHHYWKIWYMWHIFQNLSLSAWIYIWKLQRGMSCSLLTMNLCKSNNREKCDCHVAEVLMCSLFRKSRFYFSRYSRVGCTEIKVVLKVWSYFHASLIVRWF